MPRLLTAGPRQDHSQQAINYVEALLIKDHSLHSARQGGSALRVVCTPRLLTAGPRLDHSQQAINCVKTLLIKGHSLRSAR